MKTPLQRIQRGALVLSVVFVVAVVGFRFLGDYDWINAVWMVAITISTVGYGEQTSFSPTMQLFTVLVIVFGMSAAVYTFGGLIQLMLEGELDRVIGKRRMTQELHKLQRHIIVCGFGRMGKDLVFDLKSQGRPFVVIDSDRKAVEEATAAGIFCMHGDATEDCVLQSVGIDRAKSLVTSLPSDAENVFITLTARNLNAQLQIIARAEQQTSETKLRQAGADRVVMPTVVGARQMTRMITRPTTADLMDLVTQREFVDIELDEFIVTENSPLVGISIVETEAKLKHKLLVVAIKDQAGQFVFNPTADREFRPSDIVMLLGHSEDIQQFRSKYAMT